MEKRTCPFASTKIDGDPCICLDRAYICRSTYTANGSCVCLCQLSVIKRTNNTPLPAALFFPKPDAYLVKNLAANNDLPDIPNDFASSQVLIAQHIKEPVPNTISAEKPVTLSTIIETPVVAQKPDSPAEPDSEQTSKPSTSDNATAKTTESDIATATSEEDSTSSSPASKRLKLQRRILVDGFLAEKQFRLPTQAYLTVLFTQQGTVCPLTIRLKITSLHTSHTIIIGTNPCQRHSNALAVFLTLFHQPLYLISVESLRHKTRKFVTSYLYF